MDLRPTFSTLSSDQGWPHPDAEAAAEAELLREGLVVDDELDVAFDPLALATDARAGHA